MLQKLPEEIQALVVARLCARERSAVAATCSALAGLAAANPLRLREVALSRGEAEAVAFVRFAAAGHVESLARLEVRGLSALYVAANGLRDGAAWPRSVRVRVDSDGAHIVTSILAASCREVEDLTLDVEPWGDVEFNEVRARLGRLADVRGLKRLRLENPLRKEAGGARGGGASRDRVVFPHFGHEPLPTLEELSWSRGVCVPTWIVAPALRELVVGTVPWHGNPVVLGGFMPALRVLDLPDGTSLDSTFRHPGLRELRCSFKTLEWNVARVELPALETLCLRPPLPVLDLLGRSDVDFLGDGPPPALPRAFPRLYGRIREAFPGVSVIECRYVELPAPRPRPWFARMFLRLRRLFRM